MVKKETCPVCKGNKVIAVPRPTGKDEWRACPGCNGNGYQVRSISGSTFSARW